MNFAEALYSMTVIFVAKIGVEKRIEKGAKI
jgi:hypothetical protein